MDLKNFVESSATIYTILRQLLDFDMTSIEGMEKCVSSSSILNMEMSEKLL